MSPSWARKIVQEKNRAATEGGSTSSRERERKDGAPDVEQIGGAEAQRQEGAGVRCWKMERKSNGQHDGE